MNRRIAATLVALSIAAGVGTGFAVQRLNDAPAAADPPAKHQDPTTTSPGEDREPGEDGTGSAAEQRIREDRAAARLPSWSPADPIGADGQPLEIGDLELGGIPPVMAGDMVFEHMRTGYLVADQNPPCDGNHWLWAGQLSEGLFVSASPRGEIGAIGTDKDLLTTAEGIGVGSSLAVLKETYGEHLNAVSDDDQGTGWTFVEERDRWIAFQFDKPASQVTDTSRVVFIEVGKGEVLHHFTDAC